jgi:nucleoside-diphosphate-sugar epimerase
MVIPDPMNPRYSYAAGKIISEIIAINYGRTLLDRVVIFRPHNVYGPAMGWEHVVPQFILRMQEACKDPADPVRFPIQGTGKQTRSFVFIDDFIDGLKLVIDKGEHLGIYHIGTMDEVTIEALAKKVGAYFGRPLRVMPSDEPLGGTPRRCPDVQKVMELGYRPKYSLEEGLKITADWYTRHAGSAPLKSPIPIAAIPDRPAKGKTEEVAWRAAHP